MKKDKFFYKYRDKYNVILVAFNKVIRFEVVYIEHNTELGFSERSASGNYRITLSTRAEDILYLFLHEVAHCVDRDTSKRYNPSLTNMNEYVADKVAHDLMEFIGKPITDKSGKIEKHFKHAESKVKGNYHAWEQASSRASEVVAYIKESIPYLEGYCSEVIL